MKPLRIAAALPVAAVLLLTACTSSADIEAEARADSTGSSETALVVDTSPEQAERVRTD